MKLVLLMYLQGDEKCVNKLLREVKIETFSRLPVEGHAPGSSAGWYGETAPYESRVIMSILPDDQANRLVKSVAECTAVEDPRHPIRAAMMDVEKFTCCEIAQP